MQRGKALFHPGHLMGLEVMRYMAVLGVALAVTTTSAQPEGAIRLSGEEIRQAFANVRDEAAVQDAAGTTALNYWYADGRFTNEWSSPTDSGSVQGSWRVLDGKRCVLISAGLTDRIGRESCAHVYRLGDEYFSINADGSIHGIHRLSPIDHEPNE